MSFLELQAVKKIASRYSGCGIRSASFQGNTLTVGTGLGMLMFYDVRAGKYLESSINASRTVVLKASKGYVVRNTNESKACLDSHAFRFSFLKKRWTVFSRSSMCPPYTRTVTITVVQDFSLLVDRCPQIW